MLDRADVSVGLITESILELSGREGESQPS
jgi:hypothetical protein